MYGYLLGARFQNPISSSAGIISLKKINAGFTAVLVPGDEPGKLSTVLNPATNARFEKVIRAVLLEIYDLAKPFSQTCDLKICERCPYVNLCVR